MSEIEIFRQLIKLTPDGDGRWKKTLLHTFVDHPGAGVWADVNVDGAGKGNDLRRWQDDFRFCV
jgi:hypothetical protein